MLANDEAVEAVTFGDGGILASLAAGSVHVSSSTISVALSERLTAAHADAGQGFVAAPVFGRPEAAAAAKLFVVAAGAKATLQTVSPAFDAIGQRTFVVSEEPKAANLVKLSGNFLIASVIESLGEAMALVGKAGVDKQEYLEILTSTLFGAPVYKSYGGLVAGEKFELAGSDGDASGAVAHRLLTGWPGGHQYVWNRPPLPLVENMNRAVGISTGQWVMQLDDDDYLLPGAGEAMLEAIRRAGPGEAVLLFGVQIVDGGGVRRREQRFRRERYLEPKEALRRLLRNSSFVREPTAVVRRTAMEGEGLFDTSVGGAADTDMWVRLFSRYGVRCLPQATCAYTIHEAAATTGMWNPGTIRANGEIFNRAVARGIVPEPAIRRWQADWYHQFILAGAYRRLRLGRRAEAREVLRLFDLPEVRDVGVSPKWLPVRAAFTAATAGARRTAN